MTSDTRGQREGVLATSLLSLAIRADLASTEALAPASAPFLYRFNKINHCRRVATRYDKLAANYLALVKLACIRLRLRVYEFMALVDAGSIGAP